jgi:hypothetical protein
MFREEKKRKIEKKKKPQEKDAINRTKKIKQIYWRLNETKNNKIK